MTIAKYILLACLVICCLTNAIAQNNAPQNRKESLEIANIFYQNGLRFQQSSNFIESVSAFDSSIHYNPRSAEVFFSQGSSYESLQEYAKALFAFEEAIALQPGFEGAKFRKAVCLYHLKVYDQCIEQLNALIAGNGSTHETKAIFYSYSPTGDVNITTDNQLNAEYYLYRGMAYAADHQEAKAMADLDSAVIQSGGAADYYVNRGLTLQQLGKNALAIRDYEAALERNPDNQTAIVNLFTLNAAKARKYITENEGIMSGVIVPELLAQMAYDAYNDQRYEEALNYYNKALTMAPNTADWLMNRAISYGKLGLLEKAEEELLKVLTLSDFSEKVYLHLANILFLEEKYQEAISFYNLYLAIDINYGRAYFNRGIALNKIGQDDLACKDLQKAKRLGIAESATPIASICND